MSKIRSWYYQNSDRNYNDPNYKKWRTLVLKRDKFKCQWPDCGSGVKLRCHHIRRWADYPQLRFEITNGVTLCDHHHKIVKDKEEDYQMLFIKIVINKCLPKK